MPRSRKANKTNKPAPDPEDRGEIVHKQLAADEDRAHRPVDYSPEDYVEYHPIHSRSTNARNKTSKGWIRDILPAKTQGGDERYVIENYRTHKQTIYTKKSIERKLYE